MLLAVLKQERYLIALLVLILLVCGGEPVYAADGLLGIDHRLSYDDSGVWDRQLQLQFMGAMIAGELGLGIWEGGETRLGKTAWQAVDATLLASASVAVMKPVFGRIRPNNTDSPDQWFMGSANQSFPSGEVAATTAIVTPFILEYHRDNPGVYALALLPVYDGIARMKVRGHWQSDVLAGATVGALSGYLAHSLKKPVILNLLPDGVGVGLHAVW